MKKYIDADALMRKLDNLRPANLNTLYAVESIICDMPAADVEPVRHERWLSTKMCDDDNEIVNYCSGCKFVRPHNVWKSDYIFCPKCGAKMDGGSE